MAKKHVDINIFDYLPQIKPQSGFACVQVFVA